MQDEDGFFTHNNDSPFGSKRRFGQATEITPMKAANFLQEVALKQAERSTQYCMDKLKDFHKGRQVNDLHTNGGSESRGYGSGNAPRGYDNEKSVGESRQASNSTNNSTNKHGDDGDDGGDLHGSDDTDQPDFVSAVPRFYR